MARKRPKGGSAAPAWIVTFADLMSLLMAFFVMLVAFSTQDQRKLQIVAGSMRDAFGVNPESRFAGIIEVDGIPTATQVKNLRDVPPERATDHTTPNALDRTEDGLSVTTYDRGFGLAAASLRQALRDMPEILDISRNIIIEETKEGLDISLVDQDGRAMFAEGATYPFERTRLVLEAIAPVVRRMPNRITISGHTSAPRPGARQIENSWDITTGRAGAVREILAGNGLPNDRFASVVGKADTEPMFPDNPYVAPNRRVTITLLNEAPPVPPRLRL
jgi:chemotaxis protein MotB